MQTHTYIKKSSQQVIVNPGRNTSKRLEAEKIQQETIREATQKEEDDEFHQSPIIPQPLPEEEEEDEDDDDLINESLFERYDQMFTQYNNFGALFQETAHYIGLLIKKNLLLNKDFGEAILHSEQLEEKLKISGESYDNVVKVLAEKDRLIDDLLGENTSLKLQIDQLLINTQKLSQKDIVKEREDQKKSNQQQVLQGQ